MTHGPRSRHHLPYAFIGCRDYVTRTQKLSTHLDNFPVFSGYDLKTDYDYIDNNISLLHISNHQHISSRNIGRTFTISLHGTRNDNDRCDPHPQHVITKHNMSLGILKLRLCVNGIITSLLYAVISIDMQSIAS